MQRHKKGNDKFAHLGTKLRNQRKGDIVKHKEKEQDERRGKYGKPNIIGTKRATMCLQGVLLLQQQRDLIILLHLHYCLF
jgi:hypothetical protein